MSEISLLPSEMEDLTALKKVLHAGKGDAIEYVTGTKAIFDYESRVSISELDAYPESDSDWKCIDDTRKPWPNGYGQPLELVFGKKFQLPVFEKLIRSMLLDEICQFDVDMKELYSYPMVSKKLRDISKAKSGELKDNEHAHQEHHCFGMAAHTGTGYPEMDALIKKPRHVRFIIHLLRVLQPSDYEAESWQMNAEEKLTSVEQLKCDAKSLVKEEQWQDAIQKYKEALTRIDNLLLMEKPGEPEWTSLDEENVTLYLNLSLCYLNLNDYYKAIETADEALKRDDHNDKGLYRRALGRIGVWDLDEAREDLHKLLSWHPQCRAVVSKQLQRITELQKRREVVDRDCCKAMFSA